jgi:hypothetical protein
MLYGYCLMGNHFHLVLEPQACQCISRILQLLTVGDAAFRKWLAGFLPKRYGITSGYIADTLVANNVEPVIR